jgi:Uma2 family endonuclease
MTAVPVAERMTADEYLAQDNEDRRTQLIDGEIVMDEPQPLHQALVGHLYVALTDWIRAAPSRGRAWLPLDIVIDTYNVWRHDIGAKKSDYERAGLRELWLIDAAADEVLVFRRSAPDVPAFEVSLRIGRDEILTSPSLTGFALALDTLFTEEDH